MGKEKKEMNFLELLKEKKITGFFAVISLISGFLFMNQGITGNVVLNSESSFNFVPMIGFLLIICSIILGTYSLKSK